MTKPCAVPTCKTGYKSIKKKYSVFRVPKNIERFKKWLEVVPGLKQSQYVCEKHFEEQYIQRQLIKRDLNGQIIYKSSYVHPRLCDTAIPTIFNNNEEEPSILRDTAIPTIFNNDKREPSISKCANQLTNDNLLELNKNENFSSPKFIGQNISSNDSIQCERFSSTETTNSVSTCEVVTSIVKEEYSISAENENKFDVLDTLMKDYVSNMSTNTNNNVMSTISVPKLWSITELTKQEQQRILLSHFVIRQVDGIEIPILQKSVIIDTDSKLSYFVYGRIVDPQSCNLTPILQNYVQLPQILEMFKNMNICSGLGAINIYYLIINNVYKDYIDQWRDNKCTMISKRKRCNYCTKMRLQIMQKERKSKKKLLLRRIHPVLNPLDQKKLITLQKKLSRERNAKNKAKKRVQLLLKSLK